jgi:hypothetical protein
MRRFASLSWIVPALALALSALGGAVLAAPPGAFRASGTYAGTGNQGSHYESAQSGRASPGGSFTGTVSVHVLANDQRETGTATMDFGGGDALTFSFRIERDATGQFMEGSYTFIGGTGKFAGASGSGSLLVDTWNRTFELSGSL